MLEFRARRPHAHQPRPLPRDTQREKSEREPILRAAARHQVPAIAVWVQTPLAVCVERNLARPADQIVNEQGMRNVFAALEPPELSEGFSDVIEIKYRLSASTPAI